MENFIASVFSGVSQVAGKLLGHPLDFLAGKSCNTTCKPAWDFICYIENFCVSLLIKSAMVIVLFYLVLLFFYLSYKLGICQCICHTICTSIQTCFGMCFSMLECCCNFFCLKIHKHNQLRRRKRKLRDIETNYFDEEEVDNNISSQEKEAIEFRHQFPRLKSRRRHQNKDESLRRALRPRSHRIHAAGVSIHLKHKKKSIRDGDHISPGDHFRVARSSKFSRKRPSFKASMHHRR